MKTNVVFEATVAIGFGGAAVLRLNEQCAPNWHMDTDADLECVKNDIENDGAESWLEYLEADVPDKPGVYKVSGAAFFSEDESIYQDVVFKEETKRIIGSK